MKAISVVSGETGQPVAGARLVISGSEHASDARGEARFQSFAGSPTLLDIVAPGFLDRQTTLDREPSGRFTLWPRTAPYELDEAYTSRLVYTSAGGGSITGAGELPMLRWKPGLTSIDVVYLGPEDHPSYRPFAANALLQHAVAVGEMNAAIGGAIRYGQPRPGEDVAAAGTVRLLLFPEDPGCADADTWAFVRVFSYEISHPVVTFCDKDAASDASAVLHELGHTFGLQHSGHPRDVMHPAMTGRDASSMSVRERLTMRMMLQRGAGNRFPDNDRAAFGAAAAQAPKTIRCQ
jgi:hypothetical protein